MHYKVSQPLSSHQDKRRLAENPFTVLFLSLKSFISLGYASRKLSDQEERQEDCFWLPCNTQKTVTRTVDKINYFLPWSGKAETSEVSWPIMAAAPGLCTTFSSLYLEQQGSTSSYPNLSGLVSAHSRDGSVITSLLRVGHSVPTYQHTLNNVFFQYHTPLCFIRLLGNGLLYCNKGYRLWHH